MVKTRTVKIVSLCKDASIELHIIKERTHYIFNNTGKEVDYEKIFCKIERIPSPHYRLTMDQVKEIGLNLFESVTKLQEEQKGYDKEILEAKIQEILIPNVSL